MNHPIWGPILTMGLAALAGSVLGLCLAMAVRTKNMVVRAILGMVITGGLIAGVTLMDRHYICGPVSAERDCHWE